MNSLPSEAMQGGPKCKLNGKIQRCFVLYNTKTGKAKVLSIIRDNERFPIL